MKHIGQKDYLDNQKKHKRTSDVYAIYGKIIKHNFSIGSNNRPVYKAIIKTANGEVKVQTVRAMGRIEYNLTKDIKQVFIVDTHPKYQQDNIYMLCQPNLINSLKTA